MKTLNADYQKTNYLLWAAFLVYVFAWFLQVGERKAIFGTIRFEFIVAIFLLTGFFLTRFFSEQDRRERTGLFSYVTVFFMILIIHVLLSADLQLSWDVFWNRTVKFSCMALFIVAFVKSPKHLRAFLGAFLFACLYITQESFRSALDGSMVWENQGVPRLHGDTSLFQHPNSLAGLATGALPFVWFLVPVVKRKWAQLGLLALAVTAFGCILYSGSRTSYLGIIAFVFYLFFCSKRKIILLFVIPIVITFLMPMIPVEYQERFASIFTGVEIEGASMDTRKQILVDAWEVFKAYPFGVGVSAFPTVRMEMFHRMQDTHNLYLEVATNIGIHGFIAFTLLIGKVLMTFRKIRSSLDKQILNLKDRIKKLETPRVSQPGLRQHLGDIEFLRAVCYAGSGYIYIRLMLGMFGMDLYEIYWWMGIGLATAVFNINLSANEKTEKLIRGTGENPSYS